MEDKSGIPEITENNYMGAISRPQAWIPFPCLSERDTKKQTEREKKN